jgi:general secretion pathway protein D
MKNPSVIPSLRRMAAVVLVAVLGACANPALKESSQMIEKGQWQQGLARLEQAMKENPGDPELRIRYHRARERELHRALDGADAEVAAGRVDGAEVVYNQVLAIDPLHARANSGLLSAQMARRHAKLVAEARAALDKNDITLASENIKAVLTENPAHPDGRVVDRELRERELRKTTTPPVLRSKMQNAVSLEFRDSPLKLVLEALSRLSGVNFVFDREVRPDLKTTIVARDVRVEDAIEMILVQNQLERKIVSENTVLVYPGTPQKLRENQELVMRAFHLGNADVKQTVNLLRTMVKTKDIFVDERMNMLVMRDTPDAIRLAEKLVGMHDKADPEVVLEIEILEVSRSKVRDLGVTYPGQFTGPGGTLASITPLNSTNVAVNNGFALNLIRNDGETKTLANPRVRVRNKEKARVHVGDRVPVISSTLVGSGSGNPVSSEQIQYLDVGIKVETEPTVHPDNTVAVKINLDVSSLGAQTRTSNGTVAYEVGTRNVNTVLRLRDGETQALMGLIRDDDVKTRAGIPFLGELPVLDHIFGTSKSDQRSRELVLLITPHIVRSNTPPDATLAEFWSGTEARLRSQGPFAVTADSAQAIPVRVEVGAPRPEGAPAPESARTAPSASSAAPAVPASLALSWTKPEGVRAGKEFTVSLNGKGEGLLKGATVSMRYQPAELEVVAINDGGYFKRGGPDAQFTPRSEPGLGIFVASMTAGTNPAPAGEASLITLRLKPSPTATRVRLDFITIVAQDESGRPIPVSRISGFEVPVLPAQP